MRTRGAHQWRGLLEEYRDRLPVTDDTPVITLREGGTPLVRSDALSVHTDADVWLKYEGANPTGSFKDRGMTLAISKAAEEGAQAVICASTGNTSASAAAYAVRAGMVCAVLVLRPDHRHVAGAEGQDQIARADARGEDVGHRGPRRLEDDSAVRQRDGRRHVDAGGARQRVLARGVDLHDDDVVGQRERRPELGREGRGAGVAMG